MAWRPISAEWRSKRRLGLAVRINATIAPYFLKPIGTSSVVLRLLCCVINSKEENSSVRGEML